MDKIFENDIYLYEIEDFIGVKYRVLLLKLGELNQM